MRMGPDACWARLGAAGNGVLGTVHAERGVDAVPVVFVVVDGSVVVPIDAVKPKSGGRLQRLANLEDDDRCVLLVDHYAEDWSELWWVRVHARATEVVPSEAALAALTQAFTAYRVDDAITSAIALAPTGITGWSAR
jgi:PPOX class probable F420-dependent enzyme